MVTEQGIGPELASRPAAEAVEREVIDPRTLVSLDLETIVASVEKTGRARHPQLDRRSRY